MPGSAFGGLHAHHTGTGSGSCRPRSAHSAIGTGQTPAGHGYGQRQLLGVRVSFAGVSGRSMGRAPGADRGQIGGVEMGRLLSDWGALLPSQLAMPKLVQTYRYIRGEVLFRAREMTEPP